MIFASISIRVVHNACKYDSKKKLVQFKLDLFCVQHYEIYLINGVLEQNKANITLFSWLQEKKRLKR